MTDVADMTERHRRMLAEFAELCLGSARDLHMRQIAAEEGAEAAALAAALHKVGRSLRQSMALEARLRRDQEAAGREAIAAAMAEGGQAEEKRRARRRAQVEAAVERLIWTEAESDDIAKGLVGDLSDLLDAESLADGFGDEAHAVHVARLLDTLGVTLGEAGRAQAAFLDPGWRSSG